MYKVLVVDDEPAAVQHICAIIEMKCPGYEVADTAENGEEALAKVRTCQPDLVISDVKMPRMDGIRLVSRLHEEFPDVMSVIVSGFQDFEYAKGALQSGVCDYLLKPLTPAELHALLVRLEKRLDAHYYQRQTELLRAMCNNIRFDEDSGIEKYFPSKSYYAAILRKNGLPKRFSRQTGIEFFSTEEDTVLVYGRDEMESLYLYPEELVGGDSFATVVSSLYKEEQSDFYYVTAVMSADSFAIGRLPGIVNKLYRKLDESVVIGKNQLVENCLTLSQPETTARETVLREHIENLIRLQEYGKLLPEISKLFDIWEKTGHNQIYIESQIQYFLHLLQKQEPFSTEYGDYTFIIDDALYYVTSMHELKLEVLELLVLLVPSLQKTPDDDQEQLFRTILAYIDNHINEPLTISILCKQFNLSQTTLSRWFRRYKNTSFSKYLTEIRVEKAKQIMQQAPEAYVKDIAEWVGYSDQFYFSRIFRSVVGLCPKEYVKTI